MQLDGLQVKMDLLRAENEAKSGLLELKNAEQQNEIIELKSKMDAQIGSNPSSRHFKDERSDLDSINIDNMSFFNNEVGIRNFYCPSQRHLPFYILWC